jgi:flavin reductase (DIM6/NTAB) family NADH-FMN oxidoreductase RutF
VNGDAFDCLMAVLDARLAVVTTAVEDERAGCLIGFHAQSSIDPPRYAIWLSKANHTYRVGLRATHFAVHFLTATDHALAQRFGGQSGDDVDKFAGLDVADGPGNVPLIACCAHRVTLRRVTLLDDGGDHVCVTGDVVDAVGGGTFRPLTLGQAGDVEPGHDADEAAHE